MNQTQINVTMAAVVAVTTKNLTDLELAVLNNVAQLDMNPRGRIFDYEKVKALFTQADGTRMHRETKEALARVVLSRLKG